MKDFIFTSESVSEGHPDKIADQISDAILDALLTKDPQSFVACETLVKTGMVVIAGEVTTQAWVDLEDIVRKTLIDIGYTSSEIGFDGHSCAVLNAIGKQSTDIADGIQATATKEQGAGDQGLMFGYATNETDTFMPAPIQYAHALMQELAHLRKQNLLPWARPDAKAQVTVRYEQNKPVAIEAIVLSTQHSPDITQAQMEEQLIETVIKKVIPKALLGNPRYYINPTGQFLIGGPMGDCGLTGRKIIVDTYGGMARHGGGAFSGKDPSKVDRSAAYACRYIAKNIVAAGLAERCELQVSYAIGIAKPVSLYLECFGTEKIPLSKILNLVQEHFDLTPTAIINSLNLLHPIYQKTAAYGHFGRTESSFSWEQTDKANLLRTEAGLS